MFHLKRLILEAEVFLIRFVHLESLKLRQLFRESKKIKIPQF